MGQSQSPCSGRGLLSHGLGWDLGAPSPHPACAFPPPSLSHQASRKALSLFYLAEPWDNHWTGFNWPGNQSPQKNAS